uniref:Uncharacterized protein n=1 Tax=viral metagenome TaxID=1070528 RepID=A0A6M3K7X7_9ZZZZ
MTEKIEYDPTELTEYDYVCMKKLRDREVSNDFLEQLEYFYRLVDKGLAIQKQIFLYKDATNTGFRQVLTFIGHVALAAYEARCETK